MNPINTPHVALPPRPADARPRPTMANTPLPERPASPERRRIQGVDHTAVDWYTLRDALDDLVKDGHPELSWDNVMDGKPWSNDLEEDYWNHFTGALARTPGLRAEYDRILHLNYARPYTDITPLTATELREYMDTGRIPDSYTRNTPANINTPGANTTETTPKAETGAMPAPDPATPAANTNAPASAPTPAVA